MFKTTCQDSPPEMPTQVYPALFQTQRGSVIMMESPHHGAVVHVGLSSSLELCDHVTRLPENTTEYHGKVVLGN